MSLVVYNTLGRKKEPFTSLVPGQVKMYCCGPTVYDLLHVGNFRGPVFYNLVRNWLEHLGYQVNYVYNYTDVDDKIINRARDEGRSPKEVAEEFILEFKKDFESLELKPHSKNPRVTETMPEIIAVIERLIENKKAYVAEGEVFYSVPSFEGYGKLSGRKTEDLISGARIEVDQKKQSPLDFTLWKPAKPDEQSWESPWGPGRPGWHIECTAMIQAHLGEEIDIHGGGLDLAFPHHENEIAQGEGCTHKTYARYWLHNNMFNFGGAKMSKSLGNVRTMRSFLEIYHSEIYKFLTLSVHYRSEAEFTDETILQAIKSLARFYSSLKLAQSMIGDDKMESTPNSFQTLCDSAHQKIEVALNDDFNTPEVFATLYDMLKQFNGQIRLGMKVTPQVICTAQSYIQFLRRVGGLMALFQQPAEKFLTDLDNLLLKKMNLERQDIDRLVEDRWQAKMQKDFTKADALRKQLTEMGVSVQDTALASTWEVTK